MTDYQQAWDWQRRLATGRRYDAIPDSLLLLEHPHTYTLGRRGALENVLLTQGHLKRRGIVLHHVDRGGDVTYHGPGQLVGYPILKLPGERFDRIRYLRDLERALLHAIRDLGVDAGLQEGLSGVWVDDRKICALGAKIDAYGVTTHGFALNVNTDLSYFGAIVPCGLRDWGVTSIREIVGRRFSMRRVMATVIDHIGQTFHLRTQSVRPQRLLASVGLAP